MYFRLQVLPLLFATASAFRYAHFARQLETCDVACGGGWCCLEFESCVPNPGDTVDGGWGCVVQGVSNDDGSPLTDEPFNPSADAAAMNSLNSFISNESEFISSLVSALSITSSSTKGVSATSSASFTSPTLAPGTSPTSPGASSTSATPFKSSSTSSPVIITSTKATSSIPPTNTTTAILPSQVVSSSNAHSMHIENGFTAALVLSFVAAAMFAYLV